MRCWLLHLLFGLWLFCTGLIVQCQLDFWGSEDFQVFVDKLEPVFYASVQRYPPGFCVEPKPQISLDFLQMRHNPTAWENSVVLRDKTWSPPRTADTDIAEIYCPPEKPRQGLRLRQGNCGSYGGQTKTKKLGVAGTENQCFCQLAPSQYVKGMLRERISC